MKSNVFFLMFMAVCLLGMGCGGPTPLLTTLAEGQQDPPALGSTWSYQALSGGLSFTRSVTATAMVGGKSAQVLTITASAGPAPYGLAAQRLSGRMAIENIGLLLFDTPAAMGGWVVERKLPYITGASWSLPTQLGVDSRMIKVDGMETVLVPAGTFQGCYRLLETTVDADALVSKIQNIIWVSPSVGDVKYGHLDTAGVVVVDHVLTSFWLAP